MTTTDPDLCTQETESSFLSRVEQVLEVYYPGAVARTATQGQYTLDEPTPHMVRVRYGQGGVDTVVELESARSVVERAALVGAVTAESASGACLLVFPQATPEGDAVGPSWDAVAKEIRRSRAAIRRAWVVYSQLEKRTADPASVLVAAELRSALTGRRWLYRCPEHGDRPPLPQRHPPGVTCGAPLPYPWTTRSGSTCSRVALLVGEVDLL